MSNALSSFIGILFDGVAYGCLLFIISVGLSITLGLMNFVNLAHGAFAMLGGYVTVTSMARLGVPFGASVILAFMASAFVGHVLERLLYRRLYQASPLDQVLFSIGLTFVAVATATWLWGSSQQPVRLPESLQGQVSILSVEVGIYRLFMVATVAVITLALGYLMQRTRFGGQIRASVDNRAAAAGMGINVGSIFSITFALGSGLAGVGGALGIEVLGLDPTFPVKFMVYFLLVVAVGGVGTVKGPLLAAILLGIFDTVGKYYVPEVGAFVIYAVMVAVLIFLPHGLSGRAH